MERQKRIKKRNRCLDMWLSKTNPGHRIGGHGSGLWHRVQEAVSTHFSRIGILDR